MHDDGAQRTPERLATSDPHLSGSGCDHDSMSVRDDLRSVRRRVAYWRSEVAHGRIAASNEPRQHRLIVSLDDCWQEINDIMFEVCPDIMGDDDTGHGGDEVADSSRRQTAATASEPKDPAGTATSERPERPETCPLTCNSGFWCPWRDQCRAEGRRNRQPVAHP